MVTADAKAAHLHVIGVKEQAQLQPRQGREGQNLPLLLMLKWR